MQDALPASYFEPTAIGWNTIFTYFLLFFFGLMIGQDIWQRIFTGRDEKVIRRGTIFAGVYCMVYGIAGALIGAAAKVVLPRLESPDEAFAAVAEAVLPVGRHRARARRRAGRDHVDRRRRAAGLLDDHRQRPAVAGPHGHERAASPRG